MLRDEPPSARVLSRSFGPLELQLLEAVWEGGRPVTVRGLQGVFPHLAYTTLMTTLDRLHKKGVLGRTKIGRAFAYEALLDRRELEMRLTARSVADLLGEARDRGAVAPLLSCFVETVGERDRLLLDDLESLLKAKRARLRRGGL